MTVTSLLLGVVLIGSTVLMHVVGLLLVTHLASRVGGALNSPIHRVAVMIAIVLGLFGVVTVEIWTWAVSYFALGVADTFDDALYLSTITFSTVGFGDVVPAVSWRMLAALEGVTGFLIIGWSTAFLVVAGTRFGPFRSGVHF